jgi:hypothetical protein
MSMTKDQARHLLATALGITEREPIPRDLQARALVEALNGHAASAGTSSLDHDIAKPLPEGSAVAELQAHVRGEVVEQTASSGNVQPSDDMQRAVDIAVERYLAKKGLQP